jgi:cytochrome c2
LLLAAVAAAAGGIAQASDPAMLYMLNCQGCHQADGSGRPGYVPELRHSVARFLTVPEGRSYLGRVPGTSQSLLGDQERADVLNWIVHTFDPEHVPRGFQPYTPVEMAAYREDPISTAGAERARLLVLIADASPDPRPQDPARVAGVRTALPPSSAAIAPPAQFALCAACHPSSADGASAMGPNLRGIMGRRAGSLPGFAYSSAMSSAGIVWSRATLDSFLENVQGSVPGTLMAVSSVPSPDDRAGIIAYLETLR